MSQEKRISDKTFGQISLLMHKIFEGVLAGKLDPEIVLRCLREIIVYGIPCFQRDMRKERNWILAENRTDINYPTEYLKMIKPPRLEIPSAGLSLRDFLNEITGQYTDFGQHQAEYLIKNQANIPIDWKDGMIFFTGTVWRDQEGNFFMPYIELTRGKKTGSFWRIGFWNIDKKNDSRILCGNYAVLRIVEETDV